MTLFDYVPGHFGQPIDHWVTPWIAAGNKPMGYPPWSIYLDSRGFKPSHWNSLPSTKDTLAYRDSLQLPLVVEAFP